MSYFEGNSYIEHRLEEQEPFPRYPILLTGGGQGTGAALAQRFAQEGYPVILGTRNEKKFHTVRDTILSQGGTEPLPFVADITKKDDMESAYCSLGISPGTPLHYFPLAAAGLESLIRPMTSILSTVQKEKKSGRVQPDSLQEARAKMKKLVNTSESMDLAMRTNFIAPLQIFDLLHQNGHFNSQSKILTLSSSFSDETDPRDLTMYGENAPWFYLPVGYSKKMGVQGLQQRVSRTEATYIDLVAPEIEDTGVGNFFGTLHGLVQSAYPENEMVILQVTQQMVADAAWEELRRNDPTVQRIRTAYVERTGLEPSYHYNRCLTSRLNETNETV